MSYQNLDDLAYKSGKSKEELLEEMAKQLSKDTGQNYESCYQKLASHHHAAHQPV